MCRSLKFSANTYLIVNYSYIESSMSLSCHLPSIAPNFQKTKKVGFLWKYTEKEHFNRINFCDWNYSSLVPNALSDLLE